MKVFNKNKNTADEEQLIVVEHSEQTKMQRPKICCLDLEQQVFDHLKKEGYNLFNGNLGSILKIQHDKSSYDSSVYFGLERKFPSNLHEYDISVLDLTNIEKKDYVSVEKEFETRENVIYKFACRFPQTIFDPRPYILNHVYAPVIAELNRRFVQIIFASESFSVNYELIKIPSGNYETLKETLSLYNFWGSLLAKKRLGTEVSVCELNVELLTFLNKYKDNLKYTQTFSHKKKWDNDKNEYVLDETFVPLLKNINNEIVSFYKNDGELKTFVFPNIQDKINFLTDFLKNILPSYFPELFPFSTKFKWKDSKEYFLPHHSDLISDKNNIEKEYELKIQEADKRIHENSNKYKFLHELITETGDKLVHAVFQFFQWLEYEKVTIKDEESESKLEEDLEVQLDKGILIIETKGIGGTSTDSDCSQISKIKHRRCEERNAFDVFALYIVNHQRYLPPIQRTNPPFNETQIKDAVNDKRGLLSTWQLFNLYFEIQNGIISKDDAKKELLKFGLVHFKPPVKTSLGIPKQIIKGGYVIVTDLPGIKLKLGQTLYAEKNDRFEIIKVSSLQDNGKSVQEFENGEIGIGTDKKILKGTTIWI